MPQLLPAPLLTTDQLSSLALRLYSIPAELPVELSLDRTALLVCLAVDTFACLLLPFAVLLGLVSVLRKWKTPTLVFSKSAVKELVPPPLLSEKSFSSLARQLTRGGVATRQPSSNVRPRMAKDVLESFDKATTPGARQSTTTPTSTHRFVSPASGPQRVDIFDPSSPVYDSPMILPVRPAYLNGVKPVPNKPAPMNQSRSQDDLVGDILDDLVQDAVWATEFSRDLHIIASPYGKSPDSYTTKPTLPPLPTKTELRVSTESANRKEYVEAWSEVSILVKSPSDQATAVEAEPMVVESPVKQSPGKKLEELLSEIEGLDIGEEDKSEEVPKKTASPPKNDFVIAMPSDSASPEPSTSISATPPSTSTPPKIGKPNRPLSSKLPQRVPIKTPESDPNSGFGGLWYRQRTAGVHSSPGEAHTPKSLKAGRVVRERSPMRESPDAATTLKSLSRATTTPVERVRNSGSGAGSNTGSAERGLYFVRSGLPVNSKRVDDLFQGLLRGERE